MNNSDSTALADPNSVIKAGMVDKVCRVRHKSVEIESEVCRSGRDVALVFSTAAIEHRLMSNDG